MFHVLRSDLPQFDCAQGRVGVDTVGVERLAVDGPERHAVGPGPTAGEHQLASYGGIRGLQRSDVGQLRGDLAAVGGGAGDSRTVHDLVAGSDYVLEDRGAHTLRGMTGQWQLFAVRG